LLGDSAERFGADWEWLLALESETSGVRELLEAGMSVAEVTRRTGAARNTVKQAALRGRRRGVTPSGV
jgi:hypothetical protein